LFQIEKCSSKTAGLETPDTISYGFSKFWRET
jgi:hypothetical protein